MVGRDFLLLVVFTCTSRKMMGWWGGTFRCLYMYFQGNDGMMGRGFLPFVFMRTSRKIGLWGGVFLQCPVVFRWGGGQGLQWHHGEDGDVSGGHDGEAEPVSLEGVMVGRGSYGGGPDGGARLLWRRA